MRTLQFRTILITCCLVCGAVVLLCDNTSTLKQNVPTTPEQTQGKKVVHLRVQDLEVCGVNLGMSRQEIRQLKARGPKPSLTKDGAALSYVYGGFAGQKVEAYETNQDQKTCRMTGWMLRCHKLNLEFQEGQSFGEGTVLKEAFGQPDRIESADTGEIWHYEQLQLTVSTRKNRFDVFVVGKLDDY